MATSSSTTVLTQLPSLVKGVYRGPSRLVNRELYTRSIGDLNRLRKEISIVTVSRDEMVTKVHELERLVNSLSEEGLVNANGGAEWRSCSKGF
jgi:hypothetical protein